jgi:hypothetical protein
MVAMKDKTEEELDRFTVVGREEFEQMAASGKFVVRYDTNLQGTCREHVGNIQGTFRERSGNIQGTCREHSVRVERTPVSLRPNCKKHLKKVPR